MRSVGAFDWAPIWLIFVATAVIAIVVLWIGWRFGRRTRQKLGEGETPEGAVGGALGLLGFMLAFTFGLAASRADDRRAAVVEEAAAIRTAYLRADLMDETRGAEVRELLRHYVDVRLTWPHAGGVEGIVRESEELHHRLWELSAAFALERPDAETTGLFVDAVNEVVRVHGVRANLALRARVPTTLWLALYLVTLLSMFSLGHHAGMVSSKRLPAGPALILSFATVMALIADLDRPREGLLRSDQGAMMELQQSLHDGRL